MPISYVVLKVDKFTDWSPFPLATKASPEISESMFQKFENKKSNLTIAPAESELVSHNMTSTGRRLKFR
jgi:hypothetical protein